MTRAILGAQAAGRAFARVDVARPQPQLGGELAWFAFKGKKISVAQNFDIWRPTGLN